ncbi:unnamed protein product [Pylaiella littoralis]
MANSLLQTLLLLVSSSTIASAFFAPAPSIFHTGWTTPDDGVRLSSPVVARGRARLSTLIWGGQQQQQQRQHNRCVMSRNVNLVVVPETGLRSSSSSSFRDTGRGGKKAATVLGMMVGTGSSEKEGGRGAGGSGLDALVPEYGLPAEVAIELVRLDIPEVPVDRVQSFVRNWAKRRVAAETDPGWRGVVRLAQAEPKYGVPLTDMPVSHSRTHLGASLSFDGSPTDVINVDVYYLRRGGSCVMVTRGVDGLAKLGGMGPQIASLVRHSEEVITDKLQDDLSSFADDYHQRVLKGLATAAEPYDDEGVGEEDGGGGGGEQQHQQHQHQATVLADGTIDVTPPPEKKPQAVKKQRAAAPWMDGSAPPPVERMEDAPIAAELPSRMPAEGREYEVPDMTALFDEVDRPKLEAEAFELFKTMEKGGEERVVGAEAKGGADAFFSEMRADNGTSETELMTLFEAGRNASRRGGADEGSIPISTDLHQLEVMLGGDTGLRGGIDIFAGPPRPIGGRVGGPVSSSPSSSSGHSGEQTDRDGKRTKMPSAEEEEEEEQRGTYTMYDEYGDPVLELTAEEMDSLDEEELVEAMASIDVLIGELTKISKDSWNRVTASYSDLYLNRCYILAMRSRIPKSSRLERDAMIAANQAAINTVAQLAKMHQKLEMQQLEKIRDICEAALEDMETLPDKIRYMKPLLDDKFVAYMGYAIQTEREDIEKRGLSPDREPSRWLQVLGVIQKGVMAELQKSVHKDVEAISHVLRLTEPQERLALLNITISTLPSMHVRGFKRTATNIVDYYEAMGDACMDQDLRSMVLEIGENLKVLMSDERMAILTKEIDDWAAQKAEEDSVESKLRRVREYEAEDLEIRRATASGLWNKQMHPDATMDTEQRTEIKKLTDALRGQNLLRTSKIQNALAAKGVATNDDGSLANGDDDNSGASFGGFSLNQGMGGMDDDDDDDDDAFDFEDDDGSYTDDDDLRRKLNRLAGPGGAMEAESRESPHLFAPGGPLESPEMARAVGRPPANGGGEGIGGIGSGFGGGVPSLSDLEKEVAADVAGLSEVFADAKAFTSNSEEEEDAEDDWGAFDEGDWRGKSGAGVDADEDEEALSRPRGQGTGEETVPGLLGGARFGKFAREVEDVEAAAGEEGGVGDEVRDGAAKSAGR